MTKTELKNAAFKTICEYEKPDAKSQLYPEYYDELNEAINLWFKTANPQSFKVYYDSEQLDDVNIPIESIETEGIQFIDMHDQLDWDKLFEDYGSKLVKKEAYRDPNIVVQGYVNENYDTREATKITDKFMYIGSDSTYYVYLVKTE